VLRSSKEVAGVTGTREDMIVDGVRFSAST